MYTFFLTRNDIYLSETEAMFAALESEAQDVRIRYKRLEDKPTRSAEHLGIQKCIASFRTNWDKQIYFFNKYGISLGSAMVVTDLEIKAQLTMAKGYTGTFMKTYGTASTK